MGGSGSEVKERESYSNNNNNNIIIKTVKICMNCDILRNKLL